MSSPGVIRVVVVDDDEDLRDLLELTLQLAGGFEVVGLAGAVGEAVEVLDRTRPDIALLDMGLPDGNGSELIKVAQACEARSIILSAQVRELHEELLALGAATVLDKPCPPEKLVTAIRAAMA
ncbi:MAG: response regulator [Candidatus Nanopelagicales bacterium]